MSARAAGRNVLPGFLPLRAALRGMSSMRFAVGILGIVGIAASIGSVLQQDQPYAVQVGRYGGFWAGVFERLGLFDVYHAGWFLALLAFMATSTGLCVLRNAPGMWREMRNFRERMSVRSLRRMHHTFEAHEARDWDALRRHASAYLVRSGFVLRTVALAGGNGFLIAAISGAARRIGYLCTHAAIVLICVGGLVDGNLGLRWRMFLGDLQVENRDLPPDRVPARSRVPAGAASFRAAVSLTEGVPARLAYLPMTDGYLVQELPFAVELKRFTIERYANGRPKDFVSDIRITDPGGAVRDCTLRVNHPVRHRGVMLYQSGFDDGGSELTLAAHSLSAAARPLRFAGKVGGSVSVLIDGRPYEMELVEYRAMNVTSGPDGAAAASRSWFTTVPGAHAGAQRDLGPSFTYRLRGRTGQAVEWITYARPVDIDGRRYYVSGRHDPASGDVRFIRLPLDGSGGLEAFRALEHRLRDDAARRFAARALSAAARDARVAPSLERSAEVLLDIFASKGFPGVSAFLQSTVPADERDHAARLYMEILERAMLALHALDRPAAPPSEETLRFVLDALEAHSDMIALELPARIEPLSVRQVYASTIQVTRAPGAWLVYAGAGLLAIGVCALYFVRERRLWLRADRAGAHLILAYAAHRPSPALASEFDAHRTALLAHQTLP